MKELFDFSKKTSLISYHIKEEKRKYMTETVGDYFYLVALSCGGLMESPEIRYRDYQIIKANSEEQARKKYDHLNCCDFYYGTVMAYVTESSNDVAVTNNSITIRELDRFKKELGI